MINTSLVTIVIPVYNEISLLPELWRRLEEVIGYIGDSRFEVIFVDDGSTDGTFDFISGLCDKTDYVKMLSFSRNFGHQMAISAGIDHAAGDALILMDGDLQDPPEVLPKFIDEWKHGWDVVYAVRVKRKEHLLKRVSYNLFYRLMKMMSYMDVPLDSGDFCLMDRKVVDQLKAMPERNRFVRGLRAWVGFRQTGVEISRGARAEGRPKYTFAKLVKLGLDGLISFSFVPLRIMAIAGFVISGLSFLAIVLVAYQRLVRNVSPLGWSSTAILILFLGGIQLICLGIIGEYLARIFDEVKQRPLYILKGKLGFKQNKTGE
jgi:glycosyltransferase involved in cell wall biosynthesis